MKPSLREQGRVDRICTVSQYIGICLVSAVKKSTFGGSSFHFSRTTSSAYLPTNGVKS
ncbi:hypothetical protein EXN66_Car000951 [Channa argus]|uniref:Uncharacterized protein n=1 Tax=Channa argus TaxID=215402 RepID=A0A6G1QZZ4_CHAAH|nr:hypothetical protein EXN66_Car000951 [Channa argus]